MTRSHPPDRIWTGVKAGVHLIGGMILFLILSCYGQTAEIGKPQPEHKKQHSQVSDANKKSMPQPGGQQVHYAPDEVLVKFEPETDAKTIALILKEMNLETIRRFSSPNLFLLKITDGASVEAVIKRLRDQHAVKYAEPNYEVKTTQ